MRIRIYNANILTMQPGQRMFCGEVHIQDDKIVYLGTEDGASSLQWDRQINAGGNVVMPGFKDAHTHSAMTFLRSYADDLPLQEWLYDRVFPMEDKLTEEDVYWYLTSGITACFDMYQKNDAIVKASMDTGFRTVLCGSINNFVGTVEEMEQQFLKYNACDPLVSYRFGFHAEYTTSREILERMAALGQKYHAPVYTHNSETAKEVAECVERYGMTPTKFLDKLGMFEYGGGGFHCVHMTDEDLQICKDKQVWVVTNPASNLKLASGIAPIQRMKDMGIGLAIGTDGPASNNCLDMFREMFLVTGLAKLKEKDAAVVDAKEVLYMAAVQGARAIGLADCDSLAPGKQADLIMIDLHQPNMQPLNNLTKNIVYSGSKQNVVMTMIAGKILYEKGEFYVPEDVERLYADVNCRVEELKR